MKDEEYIFHSECREKKITARSARYKRTHNGKSGRVRFPSDNMTKKELNKMNGEVKSYRLNEPMSWKEFKGMPDDIKVSYIKLIREKYNAFDCHIAEMMGIGKCTFSHEMTRLGLSVGKTRGKDTKWDSEGFYAWLGGVPAVKAQELPAVNEEQEQTEAVEDETICEQADQVEKTKAIPCSGSMVFEGKVEEVMDSVKTLLGNADVHISITWDVV